MNVPTERTPLLSGQLSSTYLALPRKPDDKEIELVSEISRYAQTMAGFLNQNSMLTLHSSSATLDFQKFWQKSSDFAKIQFLRVFCTVTTPETVEKFAMLFASLLTELTIDRFNCLHSTKNIEVLIKMCPSLSSLILRDVDPARLFDTLVTKPLSQLEVSCLTVWQFQVLMEIPTLKEFKCTLLNVVYEENAYPFYKMASNKTIEKVSLTFAKDYFMPPEGVCLHIATSCPGLQSIKLEETTLNKSDIAAIKGLSKLTSFSISDGFLNADACSEIEQLSGLKSCEFIRTNLPIANILAFIMKNPQLEVIHIQLLDSTKKPVDVAMTACIQVLQVCSKITKLYVRNRLTVRDPDKEFPDLMNLLQSRPTLTELSLNLVSIPPDIAKRLFTMHLKSIHLETYEPCQLPPDTLKSSPIQKVTFWQRSPNPRLLQQLSQAPSLEEARLVLPVDESDLKTVALIRNLKRLCLFPPHDPKAPGLTDEGVTHLVQIPSLLQLYIGSDSPYLTEEGVRSSLQRAPHILSCTCYRLTPFKQPGLVSRFSDMFITFHSSASSLPPEQVCLYDIRLKKMIYQ